MQRRRPSPACRHPSWLPAALVWPAPPVLVAQQGRHPLQQVVGQLGERGSAAGGHVAGVDRLKCVMSEQPRGEVLWWASSSEEQLPAAAAARHGAPAQVNGSGHGSAGELVATTMSCCGIA